jgi:tetratricopeptide (TPR) repeat protein
VCLVVWLRSCAVPGRHASDPVVGLICRLVAAAWGVHHTCWPAGDPQARGARRPRRCLPRAGWSASVFRAAAAGRPSGKPAVAGRGSSRSLAPRGNYPAAAASQQRALALWREAGGQIGLATALNDLGVVQQLTGDYPAAAASHQQALTLYRQSGSRHGQAWALNRLGELSTRTSATSQARERHTQALAIARDLCAPLEEARALEGLGQAHLHDGNLSQATTPLRQALAIYQRINSPSAERVQETLRQYALKPASPPRSQ